MADFLDLPLKDLAQLFKALSDENRLKILLCLWDRNDSPVSVTELVEQLGLSQPLISHHLKELKFARLIEGERQGPFVYYRLKSEGIISIIEQSLHIISTDIPGFKKLIFKTKNK